MSEAPCLVRVQVCPSILKPTEPFLGMFMKGAPIQTAVSIMDPKDFLFDIFPKGSMYLYSRYLHLKGGPYIGTLRPKYILYGHMEP